MDAWDGGRNEVAALTCKDNDDNNEAQGMLLDLLAASDEQQIEQSAKPRGTFESLVRCRGPRRRGGTRKLASHLHICLWGRVLKHCLTPLHLHWQSRQLGAV